MLQSPPTSLPTSARPHIFDMTGDDLRGWCEREGLPVYRAAQIHQWVYEKGIADPALMSNLSKRDRELLADPEHGIAFLTGEIISHQKASDGTQKLLVQWMSDVGNRMSDVQADASRVSTSLPVLPSQGVASPHPKSEIRNPKSLQTECVMIPYGEEVFAAMGREAPENVRERRTACISSQIGCPVGCKFCASGIGGLDGNLSAGRIVEQVWRLQSLLEPASPHPTSDIRHPTSARISNIVFMGMGEPLANFANVTRAIRTLNAPLPHGLGISARKITISTVGLPKAIEKLADEFDLPVTLALSLHASNDEIRRSLIPWAEYTTIPELLAACQKWFDKTGREITLEYILLGGINDRPADARELARVAQSLRANINLIRYNEVAGMPFSRPEDENVRSFQRILRDANVNVHIRASRGRDIAAACGQLRHEKAMV